MILGDASMTVNASTALRATQEVLMGVTTDGRPVLATLSGPSCCPGLTEPVSRESAIGLANLLKAVADPARLQLVALLASAEAGERCVCDLTGPLGLSQPTVSHHLKVLTEAGLLTRSQRGTWAWYTLVPDRFAELGSVFADLAALRPGPSGASGPTVGSCG
jgi:ArsR family transcriptional regulator, arsenate/arsenite/antimonite-responsive transcriptional repressor